MSYNIASYAVLLHIVSLITGLKAGKVSCTLGDTHIYANHVEQVKEQLMREPKPLPHLVTELDVMETRITPIDESNLVGSATRRVDEFITAIQTLTADDFSLFDYEHHPAIKAPMAV